MEKDRTKKLKIALIHDWLTEKGGAENILSALLEVWPQAKIYTTVFRLDGPCASIAQNHEIETSFIQKLPRGVSRYRSYLPFMPLAVEQFDLSSFDIVISISYAVAKGILTGPTQLHLSYVCSPIRYAWDFQHQYLAQSGLERGIKGWLAKIILHYIRLWDLRTSNGVDDFAVISKFIAQRVKKIYRRDSSIIYPPVSTKNFALTYEKENFYLTVSRLVPYKRIDLLVDSFRKMPEKQLIIIGTGPDINNLVSKATPNIKFLGFVENEHLQEYMERARAFIFVAEEDFGIVPVEAQACGTPVIAYGKGGALETVIEGKTGLFFYEQTVESLVDAVQRFENGGYSYCLDDMRRNAERFSKERFQQEFKQFVEQKWDEFQCGSYHGPTVI